MRMRAEGRNQTTGRGWWCVAVAANRSAQMRQLRREALSVMAGRLAVCGPGGNGMGFAEQPESLHLTCLP